MRTPETIANTMPESTSMIQKRLDISSISPDPGASGAQGGPGFHFGRLVLANTVTGESNARLVAATTNTPRRSPKRLTLFHCGNGILIPSSDSDDAARRDALCFLVAHFRTGRINCRRLWGRGKTCFLDGVGTVEPAIKRHGKQDRVRQIAGIPHYK